MPHTLAAQLGQLIFLGVIVFSMWKGGRPERVAAGALLVQLAASALLNHRHGVAPEYQLLALDVAVLVVFATLAFGTTRRWLLFATAFQALCVLTHFARMLDPTLHRWAYLTTAILWGYAELIALAVGAAQMAVRRPSAASAAAV